MLYEEKQIETIPVGPLGLIPLKSCEDLGKKVDAWLVEWRKERDHDRFCWIPERFLYYRRKDSAFRLW